MDVSGVSLIWSEIEKAQPSLPPFFTKTSVGQSQGTGMVALLPLAGGTND